MSEMLCLAWPTIWDVLSFIEPMVWMAIGMVMYVWTGEVVKDE